MASEEETQMEPIVFSEDELYTLELNDDELNICFDGEVQCCVAMVDNWEEGIDALINALQKARRQCPV